MKSEPETFSIDRLAREGTAGWDGVRKYSARNFMQAMRKGDEVFFYHSNTTPSAIVGRAKVVREAFPDPTQFDPASDYFDPKSTPAKPRWVQVEVKFLEKFPHPLSLEEAKGIPQLSDMLLVRRGRLSVQPVTEREWCFILKKVRA